MKALGIIFSNIHDKEIKPLTANRTLASVPFGGRYRLIDFALSNMVNSGVTKVGIITKEHYQSLMDHIGNGKPWGLARKNGGLILLPPFAANQTDLYKSRFEAICHVENFLAKSEEPLVIMSDCDNVCNVDFSSLIKSHMAASADISVVYSKKILVDKKEHTAFTIDKQNRVVQCVKSNKLRGEQNVYAHILVMGRKFLLDIIENAGQKGYKSFSNNILTRTGEFRIFAHEIDGYYSQIEDLLSYYRVSMELMDKNTREHLFYANDANIYTKIRDSAPLVASDTACIKNSLVADGCIIEGKVENSILFRGCRVAKGAKVTNSILFQDSFIGQDSEINCVIADKETKILDKRHLSGHETYPQYIAKNTVI